MRYVVLPTLGTLGSALILTFGSWMLGIRVSFKKPLLRLDPPRFLFKYILDNSINYLLESGQIKVEDTDNRKRRKQKLLVASLISVWAFFFLIQIPLLLFMYYTFL